MYYKICQRNVDITIVENYDKYQHATSEKKEYFVNLFYVHIKYTLLNTVAVCSWIHIYEYMIVKRNL